MNLGWVICLFSLIIQECMSMAISNSAEATSVCQSCSLSKVNFKAGNNVDSVTPSVIEVGIGEDTCLQVTVVCDFTKISNQILLMIFKDNDVGITKLGSSKVTALLECSSNGNWSYNRNEVTQIECRHVQTSNFCSSNSLTFKDGATFRNSYINSDGKSVTTVVCPVEDNCSVSLQLDGADVTKVEKAEATAELVCNSGVWQYQGSPVTTVGCAATPSPCNACDTNRINLVEGNNKDGLTPKLSDPIISKEGRLTTIATCDASGIEKGYTLLLFQNKLGGPTAIGDTIITTELVCVDGNWTYTQDGITTVITDVVCLLEKRKKPFCNTCSANQITFTSKMVEGTEHPFSRGPDVDEDGCLRLTLVCPFSPMGSESFIQFNGKIGGPVEPAGIEVTAVVDCINGQWTYTKNNATTVITEVNCLGA